LLPGDLLVVEGHGNPAEVGRVGIWQGGLDPCIHQNHLIRVRCRPGEFSPTYVWAYLNSAIGRQKLLRQGKTTSGLNTISVSNVKGVAVTQPPIRLQEDFTDRVTEATILGAAQAEARNRAEMAFQSLLAGVFGEGQ
jgi:type I restriction enzyme S subunit